VSTAMNIRCLMHVPFEGPGVIADWAGDRGHTMEYTRMYEDSALPDHRDVDMLVVMGGPMNVFDFHVHPWMEEEIGWVGSCIRRGIPVMGTCLGAQIIAAALESEVRPGPYKEIGWFDLNYLPCLGDYKICKELPPAVKVFHWHGDTFDIPEGAVRIASSKAFANQGFIYEGHVVALQFHLEVTPESVRSLVENCADELTEGPYIQQAGEILSEKRYFTTNQQLMYRFMDYLAGRT